MSKHSPGVIGALARSTARLAPNPPVRSITAATGSSTVTSTVTSAPTSVATARRSASSAVPVTITVPAPSDLAYAAHVRPMCPGPWMTIDWPAWNPARPSHDTMLDSGSNSVNSSADTSSVSRARWVPGSTAMYSP